MILLFVLPIHLTARLKWLLGFTALVIALIGLVTSQIGSYLLSFLVIIILSMLSGFLLFTKERLNHVLSNSLDSSEEGLLQEREIELLRENHKENREVEQLKQQENKAISKQNEDEIIINEANFLTDRLNNKGLSNEMKQETILEEIEIDFESILSKERG